MPKEETIVQWKLRDLLQAAMYQDSPDADVRSAAEKLLEDLCSGDWCIARAEALVSAMGEDPHEPLRELDDHLGDIAMMLTKNHLVRGRAKTKRDIKAARRSAEANDGS
jgi:hypothetical protein